MARWDCIIVGSGPAGLGAAFTLIDLKPDSKILIIVGIQLESSEYKETKHKQQNHPADCCKP